MLILTACSSEQSNLSEPITENEVSPEEISNDPEEDEHSELKIYAEYVTDEELEQREKQKEEARKQRREERKKEQEEQIKKEREEKNKPKIKPFIGMTDYEALESSWGKPKKVNKTTNVYGVREQWVYEGYRYLYFENGYLTTIQE